jgi:uncharacterized protein YndB with AHSA1/START domain
MKKLSFEARIMAPAEKVYRAMLGLDDKKTYEAWSAIFNPTSTYEGSWEKGAKIRFVGLDENGNKGGMVSEIAEHLPAKFVSIRHLGLLAGESEVFDGEEVKQWADGLENYTFEEKDGVTIVHVETDTVPEYESFFKESWPKALGKLKDMVEKD